MDRRAFLCALGLLGVPSAVQAQPGSKGSRIGYLAPNLTGKAGAHLRDAFLQGLHDLGYIEGRNLVIEYRDADGRFERFPSFAAELVALKVDVIVAPVTPAARAAKQATATIPIVFAATSNPIGAGLVTAFRGRAAMPRG